MVMLLPSSSFFLRAMVVMLPLDGGYVSSFVFQFSFWHAIG